jgi:hypothetical protein
MALLITDGNAFSIIGAGTKELKRLGRRDEVEAFTAEMTAGDYDHLLRTLLKWFPDVITNDENTSDEDECGNCGTCFNDEADIKSIANTGWCEDCCYLDDTEEDDDDE